MFDEKRVFAAGPLPGPLNVRGVRLGVPICEDIWTPDVSECLAETGAENSGGAQWFALRGGQGRYAAAACGGRVGETGLPLIYLNQVGGQDELVFDGASFVLNADRAVALAHAVLAGRHRDQRMDAGRRRQMDLRAGRTRRRGKPRKRQSITP